MALALRCWLARRRCDHTSLAATKDVLGLPFAATLADAGGLLLLAYYKPKAGTDYAADLVTIQDALDDGTYSKEDASAAHVKALADDYETQTPAPRLCYQLAAPVKRCSKMTWGKSRR